MKLTIGFGHTIDAFLPWNPFSEGNIFKLSDAANKIIMQAGLDFIHLELIELGVSYQNEARSTSLTHGQHLLLETCKPVLHHLKSKVVSEVIILE